MAQHIAGGDPINQLTYGIAGIDLAGPVAIAGVVGNTALALPTWP
jgi:hypothetical protein